MESKMCESQSLLLPEKFNLILKGFLHENYKSSNDLYFEMLITHLSKIDKNDHSVVLHSPYVHEWIDQCIQILSKDFSRLNDKIITFMLKLSVLMIKNQLVIPHIKDINHLVDKIQKLIKSNLLVLTASVKLGYVRFLAAVSTRTSEGISWIKTQKAWEILISFCTENHTVYVIREAMALIYDLLYNYSVRTNDIEICRDMLKEILEPIIANVFTDSEPSVQVNNIELQIKIKPRLDLIDFIFKKTIESDCKTQIVVLCENEFDLERNLWKLSDMTHNNQFLSNIIKCLASLNFAKLINEKWKVNEKIPSSEFDQFGVNFFNHMNFLILRHDCSNLLMLAEYNHILWKKLGSRAPQEIIIENRNIQFENQLILFHLLPVLYTLRPPSIQNDDDGVFETYILKLFNITCEFTQRIFNGFRKILIGYFENTTRDLALKSINGILAMENILNKDHAMLVFQAIMYAFKNFESKSMNSNCNDMLTINPASRLLLKNPDVLRSILICVHTLIKTYHITWNDSIETMNILSVTLNLLTDQNLSSRVAVQSIKLVQLSIERALMPNLTILINNSDELGLQNLGLMIMKRLHDTSWEVRDTTLELLTSIVEISEIDFPQFQQYILDSEVCPIIFSMAKNDTELYIRASAYKCLIKMTRIDLIWEKCLKQYDILDYLMNSIDTEYEGIVRMEAVALITNIYNTQEISENHLKKLYITMADCAVVDLHWEVKIKSLNFWDCLMSHRFTKENIIYDKLTSDHTQNIAENNLQRIESVLTELSEYGCLNVLIECLNDDSDLEVVRIAVDIVKKLLECLNQYEYLKHFNDNEKNGRNEEMDVEKGIQNSNECTSVESNELIDCDRIIESIVKSNDLNLLANNYDQNLLGKQTSNSNLNENVEENCEKTNPKIKPNEFLKKILNIDLDSLIQVKNDWISHTESFESLLDDMIYSIKTLNVNDADCY